MSKELWTSEDELEYLMGDMHGIAFTDRKTNSGTKNLNKWKKIWGDRSKPIKPEKKPEALKKHIKKTGK